MKNLEKLKEKIYKLLPELKKLEFGCEVIVRENDKSDMKYIISYCEEPESGCYEDKCPTILGFYKYDDEGMVVCNLSTYFTEGIAEIIGKPIGIAEVLRIVEVVTQEQLRETGMEIELLSNWSKIFEIRIMTILSKWKLKEDNIDNQKKETIDWLNEII